MTHKHRQHIFWVWLLTLLVACSNNNDTRTPTNAGGVPAGTPAATQFQQNAVQAAAAEGTSTQLNLIASFDDGLGKAITQFDVTELAEWSSSNTAIADVSNQAGTKGLVFGNTPGSATITASFRGTVTEINFTVSDVDLVELAISPTAPNLVRGTTIDVRVNGRYSDNSVQDLTDDVSLSVANTNIATISNPSNSPARLTGVIGGTTVLTASFEGVSEQATVTVVNSDLDSLTLSPLLPSVAKGSSIDFSLTATFADGSTQDVTESAGWASGNPNFVSVSNAAGNKGDAIGVEVGTTAISATFEDETVSTDVTVTAAVLDRIEVNPASPSIAKGTSQLFTATGIFTDDTTQDLSADAEWASSDETVASISNLDGTEGETQALEVGQSTISATFQGETGSTTLTVTDAVITDLAIEPLDSNLALNRVKQFLATGTFSDGSTQDVTADVTWDSDDETIVTISNDTGDEGLASPVAEGTANISASILDLEESTSLTVVPDADITGVTVTADNTSVANGTTEQLTAVANYDDGSTEDVTSEAVWSSADEAIVTVSNEDGEEGLVTGQGVGTANITASFSGFSGNVAITVTAAVLEGITVDPIDPSIPIQSQQAFTAIGRFSDNTDQDISNQVVWASSNQTVATVSNASGSEGTATGSSIGTATISASKDELSGSSVLTVTDALLQSIQITPSAAHIADGIYQQYTATGIYSDGSNRDISNSVTWSSTQPSVASISNSGANKGRATGDQAGNTSIQAQLDGVFSASSLQVTDATLMLEVTPNNEMLPVGVQQQYTATGSFDMGVPARDMTDQVSWSSSNSTAASINPQGLATANSADPNPVTFTATHTHAIDNSITQGTEDATVIDAEVVELVITPKAQSIADGTGLQYTAMGTFSDDQVRDLTDEVDWDSSDAGVATITNIAPGKGDAEAVTPGATTISASHTDGPSDSTSLLVTDAELVSIAVSPGAASIAEGRVQSFTAIGTYTDGPDQDISADVTWTSSNTAVASISNAGGTEGDATGLSPGTAQIAAGLNGVDSNNATLTVTDAVIDTITVTAANSTTQAKGTSQQFTATADFSDGTNDVDVTEEVTWTSSAPATADVSNAQGTQGVVFVNQSANTNDTADIMAEADGVTGQVTVTVSDAVLVSIQLTPTAAEMPEGYTLQYTAIGQFSDGTSPDITDTVTWTSLDSGVATINADGLATGVAAGVTSITAAQDGVQSSTTLTVSAATLESLVISLADAGDDQELDTTETVQMKALGNFSGGISNFDVTTEVSWNSSDVSRFTIDANGLATATLLAGQADITASQDGVNSNAITLTNTGN